MGVYIIAEAGDNHNGSFELALKLVDAAKAAGADCVKFQTFVTEEVISRRAKKAEYQKAATGTEESQFDMVKKLELSFAQFRQIKDYCDQKGIRFLSTPFDLPSIQFLDTLDLPFWKSPPVRSQICPTCWQSQGRKSRLSCPPECARWRRSRPPSMY